MKLNPAAGVPPSAPAEPWQDGVMRRMAFERGVSGMRDLAIMALPSDVKAWQHEEDPARVISAAQKAQALKDGGASASSVRPYSVPLTRGADAPDDAQRLDWLMHTISGAELRRLGIITSAGCTREDIDRARNRRDEQKKGTNR